MNWLVKIVKTVVRGLADLSPGCKTATRLQSVCADDIGGEQMFNDEMIVNGIEGVFVQAGRVGLFKPFVEFEIEDLKPQGLRGADFIQVAGEPRAVLGR